MPLEAPYSDAEIAASQAGLRDAILQEAQKEAIGGTAWDVTRFSGNGITASTTESDAGTIQASIYRVKLSALERALAGADAPDAIWRFVAEVNQVVTPQIGDTLTSQADAALIFTIATLDAKYGVLVGELAPQPPL